MVQKRLRSCEANSWYIFLPMVELLFCMRNAWNRMNVDIQHGGMSSVLCCVVVSLTKSFFYSLLNNNCELCAKLCTIRDIYHHRAHAFGMKLSLTRLNAKFVHLIFPNDAMSQKNSTSHNCRAHQRKNLLGIEFALWKTYALCMQRFFSPFFFYTNNIGVQYLCWCLIDFGVGGGHRAISRFKGASHTRYYENYSNCKFFDNLSICLCSFKTKNNTKQQVTFQFIQKFHYLLFVCLIFCVNIHKNRSF